MCRRIASLNEGEAPVRAAMDAPTVEQLQVEDRHPLGNVLHGTVGENSPRNDVGERVEDFDRELD